MFIINRKEKQQKPSGSGFAEAIMTLSNANEQKKKNESINKFGKELGIENFADLDPSIQKEITGQKLAGQNKSHRTPEELEQEKENLGSIRNSFGDKFAGLYKAASEGGKTELLKTGMDAKSRGHDINEMLSNVPVDKGLEKTQVPDELPQMKNGELPSDFKWPKFDQKPQDYSPKEWADNKKNWRKENIEIFEENNRKLNAINEDILGTKKLEQLSPKLPEGFERAIINPETGEPYGLAQLAGLASPEVQEWVKTVSRFQNRAKESYGSRVTNFDLVTYMKQFPGLLNTRKGRDRIIDMMKINYDMDKLYNTALKKVYNKYKLDGISQEDADEMATKMIKKETEDLEMKYLGLNAMNERNLIKEANEKGLSGKMIDVIGPKGEEFEIDQAELKDLPEGFRPK